MPRRRDQRLSCLCSMMVIGFGSAALWSLIFAELLLAACLALASIAPLMFPAMCKLVREKNRTHERHTIGGDYPDTVSGNSGKRGSDC